MGTIQIKKVEKTVTTGKQGEERQKVKKTYGKIIYRGTLSLYDMAEHIMKPRYGVHGGRGHRCHHEAEELHSGNALGRLQGEASE